MGIDDRNGYVEHITQNMLDEQLASTDLAKDYDNTNRLKLFGRLTVL
jgi:hypothetical protein